VRIHPVSRDAYSSATIVPASFEWIDRGPLAGQVVVKPKKLPKALSYDVRYGVEVNGRRRRHGRPL